MTSRTQALTLVGVGCALIAAGITFFATQTIRPVKTHTVVITKTKIVSSVITNQTPLGAIEKHFDLRHPANVQQSTKKHNYIGCFQYTSVKTSKPKVGDWVISFCIKTQ